MVAEWRVVPSFPDYEVSEYGGVRRCRKGIRGGQVGKIMKPYIREDGYRMYILRQENRSWHRKAHQLVAEAFVGPKPFAGAEVRHLDGTRTNDHHSNLMWGTSAENKADMVAHGTRMVGESHPGVKLSQKQVETIRALASNGIYQRIIADHFSVAQSSISKIVRGERWARQSTH